MKNYDVIPADRDLATIVALQPFEDRVRSIATHRESHSVMTGDHLSVEDEDMIVFALRNLGSEKPVALADKIEQSYYLVLTPLSRERAAELAAERAKAAQPTPTSLIPDEILSGVKAELGSPAAHVDAAPGEVPKPHQIRAMSDFRERCAFKAMEGYLERYIQGIDTADEIAEASFELSDAMEKERHERVSQHASAQDDARRIFEDAYLRSRIPPPGED